MKYTTNLSQAFSFMLLVILSFPLPLAAVDLDSPAGPDDTNSAMFTLQALCDRLNSGSAGNKREASFVAPPAGPIAGVGCTLDEAMAKAPIVDNANGASAEDVLTDKTFWSLRTDGSWGFQTGTAMLNYVIATGQNRCYNNDGATISCTGTNQDGDLQKGATSTTRFTDNGDGTVTDNLTGLVWLKNANCNLQMIWSNALNFAKTLFDGSTNHNNGDCGLGDGSKAGDWRLPNLNELLTLVDRAKKSPAISDNHPFTDVRSAFYWSSTTNVKITSTAWYVYFEAGYVNTASKGAGTYYVWPVRDRQ